MNGEIQLKIKIKENLFGKITVKMEGTWEEFAPFVIKPTRKKSKSVTKKIIQKHTDFINFMKEINPENIFVAKREFLLDYQKDKKISQAMTYTRYKTVLHLFEEKKEGRSVFIRLRD
tara:strand:- start:6805 stop:7155 length:351 start_codon:yes stop_codon:yes gene_type:complete